MATTELETFTEPKLTQTSGEPRTSRAAPSAKLAPEAAPAPRRHRNRKETSEPAVAERFFLAGEATANGDTPALGREVPNEGEAIVEAFRAGVNFFTVSEFRTRADVSPSHDPMLKKEAIKNGNHSS
jgi:hypothetical protein